MSWYVGNGWKQRHHDGSFTTFILVPENKREFHSG